MKSTTAFDLVIDELKRATGKFGSFAGPHEGYAVILEELDELWDEVKGGMDDTRMREEAVQVAAMAARFLMDCCREPDGTQEVKGE